MPIQCTRRHAETLMQTHLRNHKHTHCQQLRGNINKMQTQKIQKYNHTITQANPHIHEYKHTHTKIPGKIPFTKQTNKHTHKHIDTTNTNMKTYTDTYKLQHTHKHIHKHNIERYNM